MATNKEMLQEILDRIEALEPVIEELVEAKKTLDARREKARLRMAAKRAAGGGTPALPIIPAGRVGVPSPTAVCANVREQKAANVRECSRTCSRTKEERAEIKEISPHTPYKENKGEKEENSHTNACACAREIGEPFPVSEGIVGVELFDHNTDSRFVQQRPTLEHLLKPKNHYLSRYSEEVIRAWYDQRVITDWADKKNNPIKNWKYDLEAFANYYNKHKAEQDPNRVPDANKPKLIQIEHINKDRKSCNWRGTRKEDIDHVLG